MFIIYLVILVKCCGLAVIITSGLTLCVLSSHTHTTHLPSLAFSLAFEHLDGYVYSLSCCGSLIS